MLSVKFHMPTDSENDGAVGTISWDGEFRLDPSDSETLKTVLEEPIFMPIGGKLVNIKSDVDPVLFMQGLPLHYHGSAFWADQLEDDEEHPDDGEEEIE